jgi:hypothetical protein
MVRSPPQAHRSEIPLDTLGKVAARRHRLFGSCLEAPGAIAMSLGRATSRATTTSISARSSLSAGVIA